MTTRTAARALPATTRVEDSRLWITDQDPEDLSAQEERLLTLFLANQNHSVDLTSIGRELTVPPMATSPIHTAVYRLRVKLEQRGYPGVLENVRGRGYRLHVEQAPVEGCHHEFECLHCGVTVVQLADAAAAASAL